MRVLECRKDSQMYSSNEWVQQWSLRNDVKAIYQLRRYINKLRDCPRAALSQGIFTNPILQSSEVTSSYTLFHMRNYWHAKRLLVLRMNQALHPTSQSMVSENKEWFFVNTSGSAASESNKTGLAHMWLMIPVRNDNKPQTFSKKPGTSSYCSSCLGLPACAF